MSFLSFIMPPKEKIFYKLFIDGVNTANEAANVLMDIIEKGLSENKRANLKLIKKKSAEVQNKILNQLEISFITPIEPDEIQVIANLIHKITKRIEKVVSNLKIYNLTSFDKEMKQEARLIMQATQELIKIFELFKNNAKSEKIGKINLKIKDLENQGDDISEEVTERLFSGKIKALEVIKLRDIYKDLEAALNACDTLSDKIFNIVLKLS